VADNQIWSILEDKKKNIWIGTEKGVSCFDGKSFTTYTTAQGLAHNVVVSILEDKNGDIWFGTFGGGVSRYDGKSFYTYSTTQGLADNVVRSMLADSKGNIWFGTYEGGVSCYNGKTFSTYTTANNSVYGIVEDKKGEIWIGTYGGGVSCFDGKSFKTYTTKEGLSHNAVLSILEDKHGNFWFGTAGGGVSYFDGVSFKTFTSEQGLSDNFVSQIIEDDSGRIFFGTNLGISVIVGWNNETPLFEIYNMSTGYPVKDINTGQNTMLMDSKGSIWAATGDNIAALVHFDYKTVKKDTTPPNIVIQNIRINEENMCWYSILDQKAKIDSATISQQEAMTLGKPLSQQTRDKLRLQYSNIRFDSISRYYPLPYNLILPFKNNHVTFEFAAIETSRPNMVKYQYYLEGYDNKWSPVTNKSNAVYGNILEGTYTFWLKAQSPDGIWSEPISYQLEVLPPWHRSIWAYLSYLLLSILIVYILIYLNSKRLKTANIQLEKIVQERTYEIAQQNEELEAQTEEIQKQAEVLSEANATKDKFFSIIAHDLKNPFNSIIGHSDLLVQGMEHFSIDDIHRIATRINESAHQTYMLLENLLDWSMLQRGKITPNPEFCNLKTIILEVLSQNIEQATAKSISIRNKIDIDILVFCDENMTKTILRNLISNAIKFTKTGGAVSMQYQDRGSMIEVSINDTGVGISAKNLPNLFRIDRNITTIGTNKEQGTGLGLILCKELVTKQGGTIGVKSEVGKGTTVYFTLPKD